MNMEAALPVQANVLILGATSDLAMAIAARYASENYGIVLAGRDERRLSVLAGDLHIRYRVPVAIAPFDALDFKSHELFYESLPVRPDIVYCVFGLLGDQREAQNEWRSCARIIDSNFTGAVSILNIVANDFELRRSGTIVGISSVAGDRGRQSNYIYGSAKAGFTAYLSGLRNRLVSADVHVVTVKPGFMKTRMTEGIKTPAPLTASPEKAANCIFGAVRARKNIAYVMPVWRLIMAVIVLIPEAVFKKLKL